MVKEATLNIGTPPGTLRAGANKLTDFLPRNPLLSRLHRGILIPDAGGLRWIPPVERRRVQAARARGDQRRAHKPPGLAAATHVLRHLKGAQSILFLIPLTPGTGTKAGIHSRYAGKRVT